MSSIFPSNRGDFWNLKAENDLHGLEADGFAVWLAYYFSGINALLPFQKGNGRSQWEFIRCLALHNGYVINFVNANKDEILEASSATFLANMR